MKTLTNRLYPIFAQVAPQSFCRTSRAVIYSLCKPLADRLHFVLTLLLLACGRENADTAADEANQTPTALNVVTLTQAQYQTAGIELGTTEMRKISNVLKVNGMLDVPPQNVVTISPSVGGFLKSTSLLEGMHVSKGQVIAILEHPDFIQLQQDYLESKSQLEFLAAEYQRQQELSKENVNALKTLQQAKAQYMSTKARVQGLAARLRLLNLDVARVERGQIRSTIMLYSPINGFVTQVQANIGAYITPTEVLFMLMDPEHLHAELTVFEKDIPRVKIGQQVRFTLANETQERTASVFVIHKEIAQDRSIGVHCHLHREDPALLPGTYLTALIETDQLTVPALPEKAIINVNNGVLPSKDISLCGTCYFFACPKK